MRVLFVGGTSFFGHDAVALFRDAGHAVTVLTRGLAPARHTGVRYVTADRTDPEAVRTALMGQSFDVCIDNIAYSGDDVTQLLAAVEGRLGHYVLTSSIVVYPRTGNLRPWRPSEAIPWDDVHPVGSYERYVQGKRHAEWATRRASLPWTILRPPNVEGPRDPTNRTWWFVERVLDGGPIVLPDGDLPTWRHVWSHDLARALVTVAGRREAYGETMNVVGLGAMSYWGQASLVMDGLGRRVPIERVPRDAWFEAHLGLPIGTLPSAHVWERSKVLEDLGWRATPDEVWLPEVARWYEENPRPGDEEARRRERALLERTVAGNRIPAPAIRPIPEGENRAIMGAPADPTSLCAVSCGQPSNGNHPVLHTVQVALSPLERDLLLGHYHPHGGRRILGQNALARVAWSGTSGLAVGSPALVVALRPCGDPACADCAPLPQTERHVCGVHSDGFAAANCTTAASHVVPVPESLVDVALLAGPLAAVLESLRAVAPATALVAGRGVLAQLATLLLVSGGCETHLLLEDTETSSPSVSGVPLVRRSELGSLRAVDLVVWTELWPAPPDVRERLAEGGVLASNHPTEEGPPRLVPWVPGRRAIEEALVLLADWRDTYDLAALLGPCAPWQEPSGAFLTDSFVLPRIAFREEVRL
jgi:nucleoside-diphosphate-sugar epimerase